MITKIAFFGSGWYTIPVIKKLLPLGLNVIITTEKNPDSKFLKFCKETGIVTLSISTKQDLLKNTSIIENCEIAVLASFGAIIPDEIVGSFKYGILNIHPSLLPKYKGPSPIQFQLLNGESIVGVTIIKLDDQVDHGPILAQKPYNLKGNETSEDLLSILFEEGSEMIRNLILKIEDKEEIEMTTQDHSNESWSYKIFKQNGFIDINKPPSTKKIGNMIRAFYPWPGVWFKTTLKGQEKVVKLLPDSKIQVEGKKPMGYKDFINGYDEEGKNLLIKLGLM